MSRQVTPDSDGLYQRSETEAEGASLPPPPPKSGNRSQKIAWTHRAWYGIGKDGRKVDSLTQIEIGRILGVSERTIRRWLREDISVHLDSLSREDRWLLYGMAITGRSVGEYLELIELEREAESDLSARSDDSEDEPGPFGDLDPDFDPWTSN